MKMMSKNISDHILLVGPDFKEPKGGIAQVLNVYSKYFQTFHFISTLNGNSKISKIWQVICAYFKFLYYMLFKHIEIIHIHGTANNSIKRKSLFINTAKVFRKKVIYHVHSATLPECDKTQHDFINKTFKKCDLIIALTPYWENYIRNTYDCKKVVSLENIIDYPPNVKEDSEKDATVFTFLYLGLISQHKGIYDLIDVVVNNYHLLKGKARFLIAGNGETDKLTTLIKSNNIGDVMSYIGWVSGREKAELLSQCDVYLQPTYAEGQPISILEALSYGKPILTTPVGGIPDIVKNRYNGILFTPGNKRELAEAINNFLDMSPDKVQLMGQNSLSMVEAHMPSAVVEKLENIYTNLL